MSGKKVLVVGGVAGGATAAARLRRLDESMSIKVFERGPYVSFANCGLPYYIGQTIPNRSDLLLADAQLFKQRFNIDVLIGHEVVQIDRAKRVLHVKRLSDGHVQEEPFDYLVLSPGASPLRPPGLPGIHLPGIFTLRNIPDSDAIKSWLMTHSKTNKAVIVGGGFIGLEMAENLKQLKKDVALVELSGQVMPPFDAEVMTPFHAYLKEKGIDLLLNRAVQGFKQGEETVIVQTDGGEMEADVVILAIGVRPDIALAKDCGLELGPLGGIKVDEHMRTSDPAVFAVGDSVEVQDFVTKKPAIIPLAGPANRQARIAADNICGRPSVYRGTQGTAVCKVFDMVVAMTGASEKSLIKHQIPYEKVYLHPSNHASYYPGANKLALKVLFSPEGQLLGAQATGFEGVEKRIDVLATAIQGGMSVFDLEETELCYAPQVGSAKDAINQAGFIAANVVRGDMPVVHWTSQQAAKQDAILLDVRNKGEYDKYHIEDAVLIPLPELRSRVHELPKDKTIFVHCAVGQRGYYATRLLLNLGYNAFNYSGGSTTQRAVQKL